jgi:hypothetical protein
MPAKYKRAVKHITKSMRKRGHTAKSARRIAHATATKRNIGGGPCRGRKR